MFETDDFDKVLSQYDFPEVPKFVSIEKDNSHVLINGRNDNLPTTEKPKCELQNRVDKKCDQISTKLNSDNKFDGLSTKHTKRKIINSYFDHNSKRKFPGPAGLLGGIEEPKDESICHMELLSQDINFSQNNLRGDLFESPLWVRLSADIIDWNLHDIDSIKAIKTQALAGNLRRRKAQTVTAFVEAVDRSAIDPLIILRDRTGSMKCTLHRDAWSTFSAYIVSEYCALVLWKPTVLTTGSAFKKHYLNITLSNILAIYSSAVLREDSEMKSLLDGYSVVSEEDFTVIKRENCTKSLDASLDAHSAADENDLLDGLDSIFSDEIF